MLHAQETSIPSLVVDDDIILLSPELQHLHHPHFRPPFLVKMHRVRLFSLACPFFVTANDVHAIITGLYALISPIVFVLASKMPQMSALYGAGLSFSIYVTPKLEFVLVSIPFMK